ncbi:MAG: GNAT family N-acetyltransferase [Oscillospiraceae bacterium]|nr:GNAT family N-acetyltransferase [Oscillospiraceae bacterium]
MKYETKPLTEEEEEFVQARIGAYADSMARSEHRTGEEQLVFRAADEEGTVIGGCTVNIHQWGRAVLAQLWVDGRYRRHGLGSLLIRAAENAAREKDCYYLCRGTADYMARPLYEKHGFRAFTVNRDIPAGHVSWSLAKRLDKGIPDYVPTDNSAAERYHAEPGTREDAGIISAGLERYCAEIVPDRHEYIPLGRKLVSGDGSMIAAVIAGVEGDDTAELDGIWVDDRYRGQGIGTYLMDEIEREAKENGAYVILSYCCDWVSGFFFGNGFTVRGELPDYPKGHTAYELEKRL